MNGDRCILLVEDQQQVRATLQRALQSRGFAVLAVESAAQAQDLIDTMRVDLLLTDVSLSGYIDGFALAEWVRASWPRMPIVIISGLELSDPPAWLREDPRIRLLPKPFALAALFQILDTALAGPGCDS